MSLVEDFDINSNPLKYKIIELEKRIKELEKRLDNEICVRRGRKKKESNIRVIKDLILIEGEDIELRECIILDNNNGCKGTVIEVNKKDLERLLNEIMSSDIGDSVYLDRYKIKSIEAMRDDVGDWVLS